MKVTIKSGFDEEYYQSRLKIIGLSLELDFYDGDPENNNLSRNFNSCYSIGKLIKEANELGLRGEAIEIEEVKDNNIFEY